MEKTKKSKKKSSSEGFRRKLESTYKDYVLVNGQQPASVYKFCLDLGITEDEFYTQFGSFEGVEKSIWKGFIDEAISRLESDKTFSTFNTQEKVLAFYYTLLEIFKSSRSFIISQLSNHKKLEVIPAFLKDFKFRYEEFIGGVLNDGLSSGEVAKRPYLDKRYPKLFWAHFALLLLYWKDDASPAFEQTDAYVEKSVRLAFDLIGKGVVDSALDFAKFIYQSKLK
jgi:hypothetical protein